MPTHRIIIIGLILAFFAIVAVDYWRKRNMPKTKIVIEPEESDTRLS